MTLVKICGITNLEDARMCVEAGACFLGFNFYPGSPRYIPPIEARRIIEQLPQAVTPVGIFVNEESPARVERLAREAGVSVVQLHGDEPPEYCQALKGFSLVKALRVSPTYTPEQAVSCGAQTVLLDTFCLEAYGGTGRTFQWRAALATRSLVQRLILAGGLKPENVGEAIAQVHPFAVDACSSLEIAPGMKDARLVHSFIAAVKRADVNAMDTSVQPKE